MSTLWQLALVSVVTCASASVAPAVDNHDLTWPVDAPFAEVLASGPGAIATVAPTFTDTTLVSQKNLAIQEPFPCEYLGDNGCWAPSPGIGENALYMHDNVWPARNKTCTVEASDNPNIDDVPAILKAFDECGQDGHIIFQNTTYYVNSVMNTTGLRDVDVELRGTLLWSKDIDYWVQNSLPVGFQNQSSAWYFGGERVHFYGHGYGTLDGNGQIWYDWNRARSNTPGRPHAITISNTTDSVIEGLRFVQSQMWTMTVARSQRVLLQDIYVNNSCSAENHKKYGFLCNVNTDGCDTVYADRITFLRWSVTNGDDSISMKQNSTNIYIANSTFYHGMGLAMGSIGQYPGQVEIIANVTAENIKFVRTQLAGRVKSWTGLNKGYAPNGGGGGIGYARNLTFRNFEFDQVRQAWLITQCTSYNSQHGGCDTSRFQIEDLTWGETRGTLLTNEVASLDCSAAAPCRNVQIYDNQLTWPNTTQQSSYRCNNVDSPVGFNCTEDCSNCQNRRTSGAARSLESWSSMLSLVACLWIAFIAF